MRKLIAIMAGLLVSVAFFTGLRIGEQRGYKAAHMDNELVADQVLQQVRVGFRATMAKRRLVIQQVIDDIRAEAAESNSK